MTPDSLPDLSTFEPERLAAARRQMRSALLWPARIATSYCKDDGSAAEPELNWDTHRQAVTTPVFNGTLQVELRLPALEMQFLDHGEPVPHMLDMDDRSPAHVEAWVLVELLHRNLDRDRFSKDLPFSIEGLMQGDQEEFSPHDYAAELKALTSWLSAGASVLEEIPQATGVTVVVPAMSLSARMPADSSGKGHTDRRRAVFSLGDSATVEPQFSVVRDCVGSVTPLRPDAVYPASLIQRDAMTPAAVALMIANGGASLGAA